MSNVWLVIANKLDTNEDSVLAVFDSRQSARDSERRYNKLLELRGLKSKLEVYSLEYTLNKIDFSDDCIIGIAKEDI